MPRQAIGRIACQVIGCGRTVNQNKIQPDNEWLCADHWRLVDVAFRRMMARARRRAKRLGGWTRTNRMLAHRVWDRSKRQAIERAMGI